MGGHNAYRTQQSADDWMREMEKRMLHEERRPLIRNAADILGPGIAPYTNEIQDWSAPATMLNGFYFTRPGAINSPDGSQYWIGQTQATSDGAGYELVHQFDPVTGVITGDSYIRYFYTPVGGQTIYTDWGTAGGGGGGGGAGTVIVQDEGTVVVARASTINFVGTGVTASTGPTGVATVTIPGGGSGGGGSGAPNTHGEYSTVDPVGTGVPDSVWTARLGWTVRDTVNSPATGVVYNNNGTFTVATAGWHMLSFLTSFAPSPVAPSTIRSRLSVNGTVLVTWSAVPMNDTAGVGGAITCWLPAGAVVKTEGYQVSGAPLKYDTDGTKNVFTIAAFSGLAAGSGLPSGGTAGQVLVKKSATDGDAGWTTTFQVFTFATASTTWALPHNLGQQEVDVYTADTGHTETFGNVTRVDANNATVSWGVPMTGYARVSI